MPATDFARSPHSLIVLMTAAGRFLKCEQCKLRFEFPAGADYDTVAGQFPCHSVTPPTDDAL
jgi:hypothetical protein